MKNLLSALVSILLFGPLLGQSDSCIICFSHKAGFYTKPIDLTLTSSGNDDLSIFYTIDGSEPNSSSKKYVSSIHVDTVQAIRFAGYKKGRKIVEYTNSYFINRPFTTGVVSIVTNPDDLFSYERGIYVKGCCAGESSPYSGANFWKGWEREVNVEFFEQDGTLGFNQPAGIKIFGGFSKSLPMKSVSLTARKKYGENRFKYQLFPNKDIDKFKSFILRNSGGDLIKLILEMLYLPT